MPVAPINVARVSQNLKAYNLLNTVRVTQLGLFRSQNQLATGLRFAAPSEDPLRASAALKLDRKMDSLRAVENNLRAANDALREGEAAAQDAVALAREAHTLALEGANEAASPEERKALAIVADSLLERLVAVGNRRHLDTFLFSGHYGDTLPLEVTESGVLFRGDAGRLYTIVDTDLSQDSFTISGRDFFNATSEGVRGFVDLDPRLTSETRLVDLRGATGRGVKPGPIVVSDGTQQVRIDLSGCDTIGDVIDKLNAEMPGNLTATLTTTGIDIANGTALTILDVAGGQTARELGIYTGSPVRSLVGQDLDPKLTGQTALADLMGGSGVNLSGGITISNGSRSATLSFAGAATVEDVLNTINQADVGVWARIAADGRTLEVVNRLSGGDLTVGENGGQAATLLGIRSMYAGTPLAALNDGRGVTTVEGGDFRIVTRNGTVIDIDLDALNLTTATIQDVINLINASAGGAVTASENVFGNGIRLVDNTLGANVFRVEKLNLSPAIDWLGLNASSVGGVISGRDVNPVRVDSVFTGLLELREALERDDSRSVSWAAERLRRVLTHMQEVQGELASKAGGMMDRAARVEAEVSATQVLTSDVRDADFGEAIIRFQQLQTALQANLATASRVLGLSLMDYLR
jgi:flagellar hook-associated protein 3 FlgL